MQEGGAADCVDLDGPVEGALYFTVWKRLPVPRSGENRLLGLPRYPGLFMSPGFRDNLLRPNPKRKRG